MHVRKAGGRPWGALLTGTQVGLTHLTVFSVFSDATSTGFGIGTYRSLTPNF